MTSGNLSEEPIVTGNREAAQRLARIADAFLFHNRDIHTRVDDSVVRVFDGQERVLRRSRGYAPYPVTSELSSGRNPGLRRRTEKHVLPDQGPPRVSEPAHRRSGKLRNAGLLPTKRWSA